MVRIINYKKYENTEGDIYFRLVLQGDIVMVQSQATGMYYATSQNATITSTFNEETCKSLIGQELPGRVVKVECEPYEYVVPETGEAHTFNHRWVYLPEEVSAEQAVFESPVEQPLGSDFN